MAPAAASVPDQVADAAGAHRLAQQSGQSIVIGSETTETAEVKANPDGTRTLVEYTHPVRVKQNDAWVAVNLDLAPQADGSLAPKAAPVTMSFTAGGPGSADEPVAKLVKGTAEVGFGWDRDLPPARISGGLVTYPEVFPGVDLEVKTALTGFAQNLVIKNADAAKNPDLKKITFKSHTKNTTITKDTPAARVAKSAGAGDGLVVTDGDGNQVFGGDASRMWDSSGAARHAVMGVDVGANTISVTPDQSFLADPQTVYPVRLDPDYYCTSCSKAHHAVVQSPPEWSDARNFDKTGGLLGDLKAGYLNKGELGATVAGISRTYFQMSTDALKGKFIHSAVVSAKVISSYSCSPDPTELVSTDEIDEYTTWNNQPAWREVLSENNVRNNPRVCATDGLAEFDARAAVVKAAAAPSSLATFMFKGKYENVVDKGWRRFDLNPYLEVYYNSYPNLPVNLGMEAWGNNASDALPCVTGDDRPVVATRTPRLRALVSDPDGDLLRDSGFTLYRGTSGNGTFLKEIYALDIPSGSYAEVTVPPGTLAENGVFVWSMYAGDGGLRSLRTRDCEFTVDTIAPNTPLVSSTDYPTSGFHGSVGRTGIFRFSPNGNTGPNGVQDVVRYGWSLGRDTVDSKVLVSTSSAVVDVPITPTEGGTNTLYVQAFDRAGNSAGVPQKYVFNVADPTGPVSAWNFDESGGSTAADITGAGRPLALNGAAFGPGYANNALVNTTNSFASTSTSSVNTARAFSVSAWAKLDNTNGVYAVASQDGAFASGFYLQYSPDVGRWVFSTATEDKNDAAVVRAVSSTLPQANVWTHLVGTYEPNSRRLKLYVDGKLDGTADATLFGATGAFVAGAAKWNGNRVNRMSGRVDHLQVWDRVLSAKEAADQNNFTVLRAHYNLDERSGTATKDEVTGQNAALSGGTAWSGTPVDPDDPNQVFTSKDKWLKVGVPLSGEVTGARPANLRTDRSYTVSAWVRHAGPDEYARAAVGMGDATHSPFLLGYRPETRKWGFTLAKTPAGGGVYALSDHTAEANKWVHLVATYNATSDTITLFVNGVKQSAPATVAQTFNGSGDLWLGRGIWGGQRSDLWRGDIDDARVYSGVLSATHVDSLYRATLHF